MLILTLRTDQPEAELGLLQDSTRIALERWTAHRELAETIHRKLKELLDSRKLGLNDLEGVVVFKGPGSFTGLRIGLSVANALAYSLGLPLVAEAGERWPESGAGRLAAGQNDVAAMPDYGAPPHITEPRK